jgi:CBS domain containing-hemolysin-like protein
MHVFTTALRPVIAACNGLANLIVRSLGIEPQEELRSARSSTELDSLVRSSAEGGTLPDSTATIMTRSLRFSTKTAAEVMSPRTRITAMPGTASAAALLAQAAATGHSRFPVSSGHDGRVDLDALDGVVHVKQAFTIEREQRMTRSVGEIAGPLARVPLTLRLEPLLALLRRPGLQMAVVIDEYGGTAGIVTLEDVVEELVGAVEDEHDRSEELVRDEGGSSVLSAGLRLDEAADLAPGFSAPSGPYETIGGLILSHLGRVAQPGDEVIVNGWTLTVMTVDQRRIDTLRLRAPGQDGPR